VFEIAALHSCSKILLTSVLIVTSAKYLLDRPALAYTSRAWAPKSSIPAMTFPEPNSRDNSTTHDTDYAAFYAKLTYLTRGWTACGATRVSITRVSTSQERRSCQAASYRRSPASADECGVPGGHWRVPVFRLSSLYGCNRVTHNVDKYRVLGLSAEAFWSESKDPEPLLLRCSGGSESE